MNKTLICLEIPSVGKTLEINVPGFLTIAELRPLFAEAAAQLTGHLYVSSGAEILCEKNRRTILPEEGTLAEYGIGDGDHLVMF